MPNPRLTARPFTRPMVEAVEASGLGSPRAWSRGLPSGIADALATRGALRAFVLAVALTMTCAGIGRDLWSPDEPREAEIGREMLERGLSSVPTLNGEPFLEKPPLHAWLMAIGYRVAGVSDSTARIPAAIGGVLSILIAAEIGRRSGGAGAGVCTAMVLATMARFSDVSHRAINDSLLVAAVAGAHLAILIGRERRHGAASSSVPFAWAGLSAALAFMLKGPIGPTLALAPPLLAMLALKEWKTLRYSAPRLAASTGICMLVVVVPWIVALQRSGGWGAVETSLVANSLGRALGDATRYAIPGHSRPPWFYLGALPALTAPWILALPAMLRSGALRFAAGRGANAFLTWTVLAGLALLSLPVSKRALYAAPLLPAAAALVGSWLAGIRSTPGAWDRATAALLLAVASAALALTAAGAVIAEAGRAAGVGLADLAAVGGIDRWLTLAACVAAAVWAGREALLSMRGARAPSALSVASAVCFGFLGFQLLLVPSLDASRSMRAGALDTYGALAAPGALLVLRPDETTGAVLELYTGRRVIPISEWPRRPEEVGANAAPYLVVPDSRENRELESRAEREPIAETRLTASRPLRIYRLWDGSPPSVSESAQLERLPGRTLAQEAGEKTL